jgi:hypothetical protein
MVKNILSLDDFKSKKSIQESVTPVNEMVEAIDDFYRVSVDVDLPKSLVSSFIKKVKESSGKDLRAEMGEKRLAERLVQWANENYLNIENLPVEIVTGSDKSPIQAQAQTQVQPQSQEEPTEDVQAQAQAQVQPSQSQPIQNTQAQQPNVQVQGQDQAQKAAAQVPAQEI